MSRWPGGPTVAQARDLLRRSFQLVDAALTETITEGWRELAADLLADAEAATGAKSTGELWATLSPKRGGRPAGSTSYNGPNLYVSGRLRKIEGGKTIVEVAREAGISKAAMYSAVKRHRPDLLPSRPGQRTSQ